VPWFHGDSDEVYGAPRILPDLRTDGETISSRKTVAKTMQRLGLVGICPKKWRTIASNAALPASLQRCQTRKRASNTLVLKR
jgi:hypothetical protein